MLNVYKNFIITPNNFNDEYCFDNYNINIIKKDDHFIIHIKNIISPALFYYQSNDGLYVSLNEDLLYNTLIHDNIIKDNKNNICSIYLKNKINNKSETTYNSNKYYYIQYISNYEYAFIYKDKILTELSKINYYSVDMFSDQCIEIIKNWINKYRNIFNDIYEKNGFIYSELSAGFDTKTLFGLYSHLDNIYVYSSNSIKSNINEFDVVKEFIKNKKNIKYVFNSNGEIKTNILSREKISGKGGDLYTIGNRLMSKGYLYNYMSIYWVAKNMHKVCPFLDKELLQIKIDNTHSRYLLKTILHYSLCNESILNYPYVSGGKYYNNFNDFITHHNISLEILNDFKNKILDN